MVSDVTTQFAQLLRQRVRPVAQTCQILEQFFEARLAELDSQLGELAGTGGEAFEEGKKAAEKFMGKKAQKVN
jgi:hypothetical protein